MVWPAVDALDAVTDVEAAFADGAPLLFLPAVSNIAHSFEQKGCGRARWSADVIARARIVQQRVAPVPMETNAIAVVPEDGGGYIDLRSGRRCRSTPGATLPSCSRSSGRNRCGSWRPTWEEAPARSSSSTLPSSRVVAAACQGSRGRLRSGWAETRSAVQHAETRTTAGQCGASRIIGAKTDGSAGHARGARRRLRRVSGRGFLPTTHAAGRCSRASGLPILRDRLTWLERGHERHAGSGMRRGADWRRRRWSSARWT